MPTPTQVTLKDRIKEAATADLAALNAEIASESLSAANPAEVHRWNKLGRAMNRIHWIQNGHGAARFYAAVLAGQRADITEIP